MEHFNAPLPEPNQLAITPYRAPYANARYASEWNEDAQNEVSVFTYGRIVRRHRKTILLASVAGLVLGFLAGIPMTPVYRGQTTLEVLSFNEDFMNAKETSPVSSNGNSNDVSAEENQAKLLQSQSLIDQVCARLGYIKKSQDHQPDIASSGWRHWLHLSPPSELSPRERLVSGAARSLKVQVTPRTHILVATVESSDRRLAARFANTLAQEFIQRSMEARWSNSEHTGDWLRKEIEGARLRLRNAENALQEYARESGLIFSDDNTNVAGQKLHEVQQILLAATADRINKQSRFELIRNSPPESLPDLLLVDDPNLRETSAKMNDLRRQIAALTAAVYTPKYTKVKEAQSELAILADAFEHERKDIVKRIESDYQEALRKENLLADAYNAQVREVTGQSEKTIQYNILKRDVESNRQLYDNMLQQMKQATVAAAVHVSNVRVVDPAVVPRSPASPDFRINSAVGLLAGLFLSVVTVIVREQTDRSFRQPEEIKQFTDMPLLGTIPSAAVALRLQHRIRAILAQPSVLAPINLRSSLTADAFRSTLASILFLEKKSSGCKVLVFTSASAADGKTTSTTNLALAAAEVGKRVLVVDADLRRPRIHEIFDLPNERGLSNLLFERQPEDRMLHSIQCTAIPGLDVLTAGTATEAAPYLLYSPSLSSFLRHAQARYDLVLIDTPPMLQMPDARLVGACADAVVLVVRASQTDRAMLMAAQQRFMEDRTKVLGAILNGWDPKSDASQYYREYPYTRAAAGGGR